MSLESLCIAAMEEGRSVDLSGVYYEPEYRRATPGYYIFLAGLAKLLQTRQVLEIGTYFGGATQALSRGAPAESRIVTVDIADYAGKLLAQCRNVYRVRGDSLAEPIRRHVMQHFYLPIDVLFIDSIHDFESVFQNIATYAQIAPYLILLDDIYLSPSMEKAWKSLCQLYPLNFDASELCRRSCGFGVLSTTADMVDVECRRNLPEEYSRVCGKVFKEQHGLWRLFRPDKLVPPWRRWAVDILCLDKSQNLEVFDIGAGAGLWGWLLKEMGHNVTLSDCRGIIPILDGPYDAAVAALGFPSPLSLKVERQTPLRLPEKYDIISSLGAAFYAGWQPEDWEFFILDVVKWLRPGGRVFMELNTAGLAAAPFAILKNIPIPTHHAWYENNLLVLW